MFDLDTLNKVRWTHTRSRKTWGKWVSRNTEEAICNRNVSKQTNSLQVDNFITNLWKSY